MLWTVLIPVKDTVRGKSRLDLPPLVRSQLALAMAADTATAASQVARVVVVVESAADAAALSSIPNVLAYRTPVSGLNESILDWLRRFGTDEPTAVLPGDLPDLEPADLRRALGRCTQHEFAVVADRQGVGTTLLAASTAAALRPHYGPDSFAQHQLAGAVPVPWPSSGLRRDVDVLEDLARVRGPRTAALLGRLRDHDGPAEVSAAAGP